MTDTVVKTVEVLVMVEGARIFVPVVVAGIVLAIVVIASTR